LTLHIFTFASVDTSTFASGLPNALAYWAVGAREGTGVVATATGSTGVTFDLVTSAAEAIRLYVLSRS